MSFLMILKSMSRKTTLDVELDIFAEETNDHWKFENSTFSDIFQNGFDYPGTMNNNILESKSGHHRMIGWNNGNHHMLGSYSGST
ncbi:hypothetical protein PPL_02424 [Heterostelium album PN500]|uniref:Uncharacterized protein n=1 Tax=Heterostelium pallidum (strain ATCC 26659 / Pp 5 / PN500) TaxID=670386 RepID=D3AZP0_HETP5|nr:hypothetical protein PPL_02424 [Heterostelium album PN500]EFA85419.1 hypothetical protein PPL_02424 [Heterostelium album PN500]|eukprot:XP_020437528.1 hypothetical protein PPL_02424 [Heterostelium album PN500]